MDKIFKVFGYHCDSTTVEEKTFSVFIEAVKYYVQLVSTSGLVSAALIEVDEDDENNGKILQFYSKTVKE